MTDKFEFIDAEKDTYPIVKMCLWLTVSTSGYYEWRDRPPSLGEQRRERLKLMMKEVFDANHGIYLDHSR